MSYERSKNRKLSIFRRYFLAAVLAAALFSADSLFAWETKQGTDRDGFQYEYIPNDPFASRVYTLENGLKVYLSPNHVQPRIQSLIAVRAGGADDPAESTGLAHYFEHMMFKGNSQIASLDWAKEKPCLEKIENLFNEYRKETDTEKRAALYRQIDKLSSEAAQYSNDEYWKLIQSIGGTDVNAWTGYDETVYISEIPSTMLDKFLYLEYVRFSGIALRRFHTELETVYEEFNRGQDSGSRIGREATQKALFPKHPYGRSIIGLPEHLKSPSMTDIGTFFREHYIPRNMALILSGDLEYENAMRLVRKYFGLLKNPETKATQSSGRVMEDAPLKGIQTVEVSHPDAEYLMLAYRFEATEENEIMLGMIDRIMNNGMCGIMELDLELPRKVLSESSGTQILKDYLIHIYTAVPAPGKTLEETRDMVLAEIEKLKRGEFPDWLPGAIVNNDRLSLITVAEDRGTAANVLKDAFILSHPLADQLNMIEKSASITREQIMEFAKKNLTDNYAVTFKRSAPNQKQVKAVKPPITPIEVKDELSPFAKNFMNLPENPEPDPVYPDFEKDMKEAVLTDGVKLYATENTQNERFSLTFTFSTGTRSDKELALALACVSDLGTDRYSAPELKQEWYKLASSMNAFTEVDSCGFELHGLQRNFKASLELFEHVVRNLKADKEAFQAHVAAVGKSRADRRTTASSRRSAAVAYALYGGPQNYSADLMPVKEMEKLDAEKLVKNVHNLFDYEHDISYYGPEKIDVVEQELKALHKMPETAKKLPETKYFKFAEHKENEVFVVDMPNAAQSSIALFRIDEKFRPEQYAFEDVFTDCEQSIFMTELRERQALAYSVGAVYSTPGIQPDAYSYTGGFIESQHDKLLISLDEIIRLFDHDETMENQFATSKSNVLSQYRNMRTHKENYYGLMRTMKKFHLKESARKIAYNGISAMTFDDYRKELKRRIDGRCNIIVIVTDMKQFDVEKLKPYGKMRVLTPDEIFPND